MKNELLINKIEIKPGSKFRKIVYNNIEPNKYNEQLLPEILFIASFPPRECGIATYSKDLIDSINNKFSKSFALSVCALESNNEKHNYPEIVKSTLNTDQPQDFKKIAKTINNNPQIKIVMIHMNSGFT